MPAIAIVRTVFDRRNADPNAELVLGEVVTMPGRWSSYPPHHHPQPEIYHYRFTKPQGFGHAELGEQVLKVRQYDTVKILDGLDHAQCAAPGYGMYYAWVIRHLPDNPYGIPGIHRGASLDHRSQGRILEAARRHLNGSRASTSSPSAASPSISTASRPAAGWRIWRASPNISAAVPPTSPWARRGSA